MKQFNLSVYIYNPALFLRTSIETEKKRHNLHTPKFRSNRNDWDKIIQSSQVFIGKPTTYDGKKKQSSYTSSIWSWRTEKPKDIIFTHIESEPDKDLQKGIN